MKIAARAVSLCSLAAMAALLGLSIFEGLGDAVGGWRVVPVLSGSMAPQMPTGSAVIIWKTPLRDLHVGSIVAYQIPVLDHHVEMHRVVHLKRSGEDVTIKTKGDANKTPDSWTAKLSGASFWSVGADLPWIGYPIVYLQRPLIRLLATFGAALSFLLSSRRRAQEDDDVRVVDADLADAIVNALESELAAERERTSSALAALTRRVEELRDEEAHRRRMHEVDELVHRPHTAPAAAVETVDLSLVDVLQARVDAARAAVTGRAA